MVGFREDTLATVAMAMPAQLHTIAQCIERPLYSTVDMELAHVKHCCFVQRDLAVRHGLNHGSSMALA